jgi:hypothetical protein
VSAEHLIACAGKRLNLPTSLAFGGKDGRTVYVGSLGLPHLVSFEAPVGGLSAYPVPDNFGKSHSDSIRF